MFCGIGSRFLRQTSYMIPLVPLAIKKSPLLRCYEEAEDKDAPTRYSEDEKRTIELFERCSPSVVHITTQLDIPTNWFEIARVDSGAGSGFIWDREGHIVTNFHVIRNASRANVTLYDHTVIEAELVGAEPDVDVAVLKVNFNKARTNGSNVTPVTVGKSSNLRVGQRVFAIGNPFGLDQSLSEGVVSGVGRQIEGVGGRVIKNVIQTDAAINPGNSGGPLLDGNGRLVGINTMIASQSGAWSGIGFAVPSATVARTVNQIIKYGKTIRPWLGLSLAPMTITQRGRQSKTEGVLVISVQVGSPADVAGIRGTTRDSYTGSITMGDEIIEIDGQKVVDPEQISDSVESKNVGDTVQLRIKRDGRYQNLKVTLKDRPTSYHGSSGESIPFRKRSRL
jgi:S1-C subfamily serine protease